MAHQTQQQARPPYVEFEERGEEDRGETLKQGTLVMRQVDYAILHPLGSKDTVEKVATEWLTHIELLAQRGEYPREWAKFFREQYNDWKGGSDAGKVNGLHVKDWPAISRAQATVLIAAGVRTVEDLAAAPEEALNRIGMGARDLKQRAQALLDARETGKSAEELASLRQENADLKNQMKELNKKLDTLVAALESQQTESVEPRRKRA